MYKLVLIRHGESTWNLENRFTGWVDVDLTDTGAAQARLAGKLLKEAGFAFDVAYTSVLKRAIRTLWHVQDEMDQMWIPVRNEWRLNERHYGALAGLNKAETAAKFGDEQVLVWRRSYDTPPPALEPTDPRASYDDPRYANVPRKEIPLTECLKDTVARVLPLWNESIAPDIQSGKRVVIAAHGNSIRALVKYLDQISDDDIVGLNIPNAPRSSMSWTPTCAPCATTTWATRKPSPPRWRPWPARARPAEGPPGACASHGAAAHRPPVRDRPFSPHRLILSDKPPRAPARGGGSRHNPPTYTFRQPSCVRRSRTSALFRSDLSPACSPRCRFRQPRRIHPARCHWTSCG